MTAHNPKQIPVLYNSKIRTRGDHYRKGLLCNRRRTHTPKIMSGLGEKSNSFALTFTPKKGINPGIIFALLSLMLNS